MLNEKIQKELDAIDKKHPIKNDADLYHALEKIIKKEERKLFNKNYDLISECNEFMFKLYADNNSVRRPFKIQKIFISAAVILSVVILTGLAVIAVDPIVGIFNYFKDNPDVTILTVDGVTYKIMRDTKTYDSIDDMTDIENIDILFPAKLPDGIVVDYVKKITENESSEYYIAFNIDSLFYRISEKCKINVDDTNNFNKITTDNGLEVLYLEINGMFEAVFYCDDYEYIITCYDYDLMLEIINQLEWL